MSFVVFNRFFFLFLFSSFFFQSSSQHLGNGKDGSPSLSGIMNAYTFLTADAHRCDGLLRVHDASAFSSGDLILIVQMQGAVIDNNNLPSYGSILEYGTCGNYEYARVNSTGPGIIVLSYALARDYSATGKTQVVRVPQYVNPVVTGTLTCKEWDGYSGGILALDVTGTITFNANINVTGKGFRGGMHYKGNHVFLILYEYAAEPDPTLYALKGEGIAGYGVPMLIAGRGAPASGGGGGNIHTTGGGGGANGGPGGDGGWGYPMDTTEDEKTVFGIGGYPLDYSAKLFMGGGGGAGHEHFGNGTSGAAGGGLVIITADNMEGNDHYLFANGANSESSGAYGDGTGGAGGGGTVYLRAAQVSSPLDIYANGGDGGNSIYIYFGPGGGGGGGTVLFPSSSVPAGITLSISGGKGGLAGGTPYGAKDGFPGQVLFDQAIFINDSVPAVYANFNSSLLTLTKVRFHNLTAGATWYMWDFGDGKTSNETSPEHDYEQAGEYLVRLVAMNEWECADTAFDTIIILFPNVFTPNGDGINDEFYFSTAPDSTVNFEFYIFNRWGIQIFSGDMSQQRWDGNTRSNQPVPEGTYFYLLKIVNNGVEEKNYAGTVLLIR